MREMGLDCKWLRSSELCGRELFYVGVTDEVGACLALFLQYYHVRGIYEFHPEN
jgi:hypothetical protein